MATVETVNTEPAPMHEMTVGRFLQTHRESAGITLRALAPQVGYTIGYLSLIENGHKVAPIETVARIADGIVALSKKAAT